MLCRPHWRTPCPWERGACKPLRAFPELLCVRERRRQGAGDHAPPGSGPREAASPEWAVDSLQASGEAFPVEVTPVECLWFLLTVLTSGS